MESLVSYEVTNGYKHDSSTQERSKPKEGSKEACLFALRIIKLFSVKQTHNGGTNFPQAPELVGLTVF